MSRYRIRVDLTSVFAPPRDCPGCGAADLSGVPDGERVRFHCPACGTTWFAELGQLYPIESFPETDAGPGAGGGAGSEAGAC
jgi:hypothetical protein